MKNLIAFPNGVRLVVDPMPGLETTAFGVWAHAGSVDETQEEHGVAHLLEHMAFKGTATRSAREIAEEIEEVGGFLNAATSHQRTGYYARILKDDLPVAAELIADILLHPLFDPDELAKEQEVVVQEIGEAADLPDDVVFENLMSIAWKGGPIARPILGTPQSVRAQTPQSLREFMRRCYGPSETVVAIAGAVDETEAEKLVERLFAAQSPREKRKEPATPVFQAGLSHDDRALEQTHIAVAFPGVPATHEDFYATRLFADILGGGMSSRLFQTIREDRGLAYSVYAFADGYEQCGLLGAYAGVDSENAAETAGLIWREMAALSEGALAAELDRARAMLRSSLMMALESPAARIESAAGQLFAFGELLEAKDIMERLADVTLADVARCAERALSSAPAVSIVGPADADAINSGFGNAAS